MHCRHDGAELRPPHQGEPAIAGSMLIAMT
jgi:hypothetical protein